MPESAIFEASTPNREFRNAPQRQNNTPVDVWWKSFEDKDLHQTISTALDHNPDARAIARRIDQASARLVQARSPLFPQIDGEASIAKRWEESGDRSSDASLGFLLDWELDVWGRIKSGREARADELNAAAEDWRAARLFLTAAVAEAWYQLAEQRLQRKLVDDQVELNQTLLDLTRLRFGQGQGSSVDVLQQQQQLESTQVLIPDIEAQIEGFELTLALLAGQIPTETTRFSGADHLAKLPPHPASGIPSGLLDSRPDLRAQRARVRAVDHEVAEALADLLPRFSIGGSAALAGSPSLDSLVGNAVASAVGPIIDGGNRRAEVENRKSRLAEELDIYQSLYLSAVSETETALSQEREVRRRLQLQEKQLNTVRKLLTESRNRHRQGLTDYLPVLDALSRVQQLERSLITSRRELISVRIALHRALGGPMPLP